MPVSHRPFFLLVAGLAVGPAPACLHISGSMTPTVTSTTPPAKPSDFSVLRPGEVVPINPDAKAAARAKPTQPAPIPASDKRSPTTTAGARPTQQPDPEPDIPTPPGEVVPVTAAEPATLPKLVGPPVPEAPLLAAVRAYVENRPEEAIRHLEKLDRPNQDFALAVMPVLARGAAMNWAAPDPQEAGHLAEQLNSASAKLEAKAALRVEKVAFCKKIFGFGRYDPWPEAQPYRPSDLARLYVEVRNLGCTPASDGYLSRAVVALEVRDAKGQLVEQVDPADYRQRVSVARWEHTERSRSPVRDYFRPYQINIPRQAGVYTVTVEVRDPVGGRAARSQPAEFRVAGP
jgi:hypothetical protein